MTSFRPKEALRVMHVDRLNAWLVDLCTDNRMENWWKSVENLKKIDGKLMENSWKVDGKLIKIRVDG